MVFNFFKKLIGSDESVIKDPITPPTNTPIDNSPGRMVIDDVFSIKGRGTVATGRVSSGSFHIGQSIIIETQNGQIQTVINGIESFRKTHQIANAGDNVGLLLNDVERTAIGSGDKIQAI